jgi:hypothetical protein
MHTKGNDADPPEESHGPLQVTVSNVGGITQGAIEFEPGVTILAGQNASNKSSILQGVAGVLGGPTPSLKSDANSGQVRLDAGDEYFVELARAAGRAVVTDAHRYTSERDLAELFVSLDERNPIRRAVVGDGDLHDLLMRPVDTDAIEAEIARLERRKSSIDDQITRIDRRENRLAGLESRAQSLEADLQVVEDELARKRRSIREAETDEDASGEARKLLDELEARRTERETVRDRIRTQRSALESLREEREELQDRIEALEREGTAEDLEAIQHEIDQLRQEKTALTNTISSLSPLVEMNQQLLGDDGSVPDEMSDDDVVGQLDPSSRTMTCWTCGSSVERSRIAEQVQVVQEIVREKRDQRRATEDRLESLSEQLRRREETETKREELADRDRELEREMETRERTISERQADREALDEAIGELESAVEDTEELRDSAVVDRHQEVSQLEYRRGHLESKLESVREEIAEIAEQLEQREELVDERDAVQDRLRAERDRIETTERETVSTINECMQQVLDLLAYENLERVWVERVAQRGGPSSASFELHVVRTTTDGTAYEDVVDHLSKSEREVVGLVVALAGYIVHDVAEEVPAVVIDAIEMLDADRIQALLDFFGRHARYVVAATLPEEAAELAESYAQVDVSAAVAA